ncbi:hypothetical protein OG758_48265 [Streptomyces sp. NBC_01474]|uniref:hypothetical protein n=1 Tax=unclassified Streptomyces TaxID=2593676 RepID=UPI002DD8C4E6|nr:MULTISPECIES: hypothetical protein [unclassified Streptomyces]WSE01221.1 hypothetical protein OG758_48265 [Streptomyces sp. NBC_01474]
MSDAVYGLVGALGGSLFTAAVAYWGPLHQQREVARQAELQRSADMRRAETEIEAARAQAEEARRHAAIQAEIGRLVDVRSTLRAWQFVLDGASAEIQLGIFDVDRFREEEREATAKSMRALDEVMHDSWYVSLSHYGDAYEPPPTHSSSAHGLLTEILKAYGARIRTLGLAGRPASVEEKEQLNELKARASHERGRMSEIIEDRLEGIVGDSPRTSAPRRSPETRPQP